MAHLKYNPKLTTKNIPEELLGIHRKTKLKK